MSESAGAALGRRRANRLLGVMLLGHLALAAAGPLHESIPFYLAANAVLFLLYARLMSESDGLRWPTLLLGALALRLAHLIDLPSLSDDFFRYLVEGRMVREGLNPYLISPELFASTFANDPFVASVNHPELPAIYPPLAQYFFALVGGISYSVWALKLSLILCDLAVGALLGRLLEQEGRPCSAAGWYLLNPLVVLEVASSGHFEPLGILLALMAVYAYRLGDRRKAIVAVAGATAVKLIPGIGALALVRRWGWKAGAATGAIVLGLYLPFIGGGLDLFGSLGVYQRHWVSNPALFALLEPMLGVGGAKAIGYAALAAMLGWSWARRRSLEDLFYWGFLVLILFSPTIHPWYLLWILPFAALRPLPPVWIWVWSWSVGLSYAAFGLWEPSDAWELPGWAIALEYGSVALAWGAAYPRKASTRSKGM